MGELLRDIAEVHKLNKKLDDVGIYSVSTFTPWHTDAIGVHCSAKFMHKHYPEYKLRERNAYSTPVEMFHIVEYSGMKYKFFALLDNAAAKAESKKQKVLPKED